MSGCPFDIFINGRCKEAHGALKVKEKIVGVFTAGSLRVMPDL
jgi:hypothetical protein